MIRRVLTFSENIHHLHSTPEGLWIGHQGGVTFLDPHTSEPRKWTTRDGLPAHPVLHVASDGKRLALATPNGVAWCDDVSQLLRSKKDSSCWQRGLAHPQGAGAYLNGVAFVRGRIYAAAGGGRIYREGGQGFELLEIPVPQARLVRFLALRSPEDRFRLLLLTNNSGVLLLATGTNEEPSLYQWTEEEGLASRYVTTTARVGEHIVVAVHGCLHVASERTLLDEPASLCRWGRVELGNSSGPPDHNRIPALCEHEGFLYIAASSGLYRVSPADLETALERSVRATRIDDAPVRQLASAGGDLWAVQGAVLGRFGVGSSRSDGHAGVERAGPVQGPSRTESQPTESRSFLFRVRGRFGGRKREEPAPAPVRSAATPRRNRFLAEYRWRSPGSEPECRQALALAPSPEGLAVGAEGARVVLHLGGRWQTEVVVRLRRPPEVHSVAYDPENACFWAAMRYGLFQRDDRGRWHRDLTFPGRTVHALVVWRDNLFALGSAGLHVFVQGEWSEVRFDGEMPPLFAGASSHTALALAARPGGGFFVWDRSKQQPEPVEIPVGRANCMTWGENGHLWLGGDRGLVCWDGRRAQSFTWQDERRDHVTALVVHDGHLYVGSQAGVWKTTFGNLHPSEGEKLESQGERLGLLEGLPNLNVTSFVVQDSEVWAGTHAGLALLD